LPEPGGVAQLGLGLLSLEKETLCTAGEIRLCISQQLLEGRDGTGRHDIDLEGLCLGPAVYGAASGQRGGFFTIGAEVLTVQGAPARDGQGSMWRVEC
jgi:hypothetical protein